MNGCVEATGASIGVEVDGEEGASDDAEGVSFPVSNNLCFWLEIRYKFDVEFELSIDVAVLICDECALKYTHLVDSDFLILHQRCITTFLMMNLRVRKLLF